MATRFSWRPASPLPSTATGLSRAFPGLFRAFPGLFRAFATWFQSCAVVDQIWTGGRADWWAGEVVRFRVFILLRVSVCGVRSHFRSLRACALPRSPGFGGGREAIPLMCIKDCFHLLPRAAAAVLSWASNGGGFPGASAPLKRQDAGQRERADGTGIISAALSTCAFRAQDKGKISQLSVFGFYLSRTPRATPRRPSLSHLRPSESLSPMERAPRSQAPSLPPSLSFQDDPRLPSLSLTLVLLTATLALHRNGVDARARR